jgi:PilZ domain
VRAEWTPRARTEVDAKMKHEAILEGQEWLPRDTRVDALFDVRVHCDAGEVDAHILNLSSDGFRLHTADPLQVGWEVTLEAAKQFPVKALICWACGHDAGGVFAEPIAL